MEKKPIQIILFHADWCVHCVRFMPTWNNILEELKEESNIGLEAHEDKTLDKLLENEKSINGEEVTAFPTIKIKIFGNEYEYKGQKTKENILDFIIKKLKELKDGNTEVKLEGGKKKSKSMSKSKKASSKSKKDMSKKKKGSSKNKKGPKSVFKKLTDREFKRIEKEETIQLDKELKLEDELNENEIKDSKDIKEEEFEEKNYEDQGDKLGVDALFGGKLKTIKLNIDSDMLKITNNSSTLIDELLKL